MLEITITICILLFFIFPLPGVAAGLGVWTFYQIYHKFLLLKKQPPPWKKIVWLHMLTGTINTLLSLLVAGLLSFIVYFLIFENLRLFVFNFIFCFIISFRWFDFMHVFYRRMIMKMKKISHPPMPEAVFVMLTGQNSGTGMGIGMTAVSLDSGYMYLEGTQLIFEGVIARRVFSQTSVLSLEKVSSEKIKLRVTRQSSSDTAEAWVITLRQQFYPFKTKELRDQWFEKLSGFQEPEFAEIVPASIGFFRQPSA